jgi:hypothetical protein
VEKRSPDGGRSFTIHSMPLENYDLLDPGALLADVARSTTLTAGRSLLALVAAPTTTQQVLRVDTLPVDCTSRSRTT